MLHHMAAAECAFHTWGKGSPAFDMLTCVDYMVVRDILSAHPGTTNVGSDVF